MAGRRRSADVTTGLLRDFTVKVAILLRRTNCPGRCQEMELASRQDDRASIAVAAAAYPKIAPTAFTCHSVSGVSICRSGTLRDIISLPI